MKSIKTEITINASKEEVWKALMNHKAYSNWNPFVKHIEGNSNEGGTLFIIVQSEGNKPMKFKPVVLKNEQNHEFRWKGKLFFKGLFDGEHYFKIILQKEGVVKFVHGENFTGLFSAAIFNMIHEDTKKGFNQMNEALKALCEKG